MFNLVRLTNRQLLYLPGEAAFELQVRMGYLPALSLCWSNW
jgi:hypothetical protein